MAVANTSAGLGRPKAGILLFATALVHNKPSELTIREYLRLLQQHEAKGRQEDALSSTYRHLDRSSWWRSEFEREKEVSAAAQREVEDLRLEIDTLKARLESTNPTKKRKKVDEDVVPVPRSPKRSKQNDSSTKRISGDAEAIAAFDFTSIGEVGITLMRSFYQVNAILRSNQRTEPAILAHQCVRAASVVPDVLHQALRKQSSNADNAANDLKLILTACSRAILSLIMGFNRLSHVTNGAQVQGKVIYAAVQMYMKLADAINETSKSEVTKSENVDHPPAVQQASSSKTKGKQTSKPETIKPNTRLNLITTFLCGIIDHLDPKIEAHKALFEGFAYIVLEKLGSRLYTLTFGHCRGETIESEIAIANKKDENDNSDEAKRETLTLKCAKLEAPYLIRLLNRVMSSAPAHLGAVISAKTAKAKMANDNSSIKGALAVAAKDRLQRTLVNCMFGTRGMAEIHPLMNCLKLPGPSDAELPIPKIKEAEVSDWFCEEIWKSLGWEILSKEQDW